MPLIITPAIRDKIEKKHGVSEREVHQCFENRDRAGKLLLDTREQHKTDPPSQWFIARTNSNRLLKVIFVRSGRDVFLKSAFEPNDVEIAIYNKLGLGK
jgi:hypothetical protein